MQMTPVSFNKRWFQLGASLAPYVQTMPDVTVLVLEGPDVRQRLEGECAALVEAKGDDIRFVVGRCNLEPSLKATCFQPLNLRVHTVLAT